MFILLVIPLLPPKGSLARTISCEFPADPCLNRGLAAQGGASYLIGRRGLKVQEYECGKKLVIREAWFGAKIALVKEVCENAEPSRSSESALEIHRPVQFRGTGFGASVAPTDGTSGHSFVPEVASPDR